MSGSPGRSCSSAISHSLALLCSALLLLCPLGVGAALAQSWDEIVAAGRKEGRVLFYNNLQPNGIEPLLQKFRARYPEISVEQIRLGSNALIERYETEHNAGRHLADVVLTFPDERLDAGEKAGWMLDWMPPEAKNFPDDAIVRGHIFVLQQSREALIWNKRLVKDADAPKTWEDLFDPKWKGKVGMNPPWRSVSIQQIIAFWENIGIKDPAGRMKANEVRFFEGSGGIVQAVLRGDVRVAEVTDLPLNPLIEDGAPLGFTYPRAGTTLSFGKGFVVAKAPHPNAGKVFLNWLMTKEGQEALQMHGGLAVTRKDVTPPKHIPPTSALSGAVDGETILTPERQKKIVAEWRGVFGIR